MVEDCPLVFHKDLKQYVTRTILFLNEANLLQKQKCGIQPNTLEVLWTCDKAGDTFLLSFQILNVDKAQSQDNARCALLFVANDNYDNLSAVFRRSNLGNFNQLFILMNL